MFQRDESHHSKGGAETVIGPSVKVNGNFTGAGDIIVEGSVSGTLKTAKSLHVGEAAKIKADVTAENVFVAGEIRGNVVCRGRLELKATAKLIGNVEAQSLAVESGAVLHGRCQMLGQEAKEPTGDWRPTPALVRGAGPGTDARPVHPAGRDKRSEDGDQRPTTEPTDGSRAKTAKKS